MTHVSLPEIPHEFEVSTYVKDGEVWFSISSSRLRVFASGSAGYGLDAILRDVYGLIFDRLFPDAGLDRLIAWLGSDTPIPADLVSPWMFASQHPYMQDRIPHDRRYPRPLDVRFLSQITSRIGGIP